MKKANIILSAIGLLSVIGGALAFKAQHRFSGNFACYTSANKQRTGNIYTTANTVPTSPTLLCTVKDAPAGQYNSFKVTVNL